MKTREELDKEAFECFWRKNFELYVEDFSDDFIAKDLFKEGINYARQESQKEIEELKEDLKWALSSDNLLDPEWNEVEKIKAKYNI